MEGRESVAKRQPIRDLYNNRIPAVRVLVAKAHDFGGVILVLRPDTSGFQLTPLLAVPAGFLYACAMVLTSIKCRNDNPFALALALNIVFIAAGVTLGLFLGQEDSLIFGPWQGVDFYLIGVIEALAGGILIGSVGAAIAYQNGAPSTVAAFDYSYLVFSLIWASLFLGELPDILALSGIAIIVLTGFLSLPRAESRKT